MKILEITLLLIGVIALGGYFARRAFVTNRNFFAGKLSWKNEIKAGSRVILALVLFIIYSALIFIFFSLI